jgi:translation initiation factor IF-1
MLEGRHTKYTDPKPQGGLYCMSRDDLIRFEGKVVDMTGGGNYQIALDNGMTISARLSGKMKKFKIKVIVGDSVTVGVSPYDPTHGLITHRKKV